MQKENYVGLQSEHEICGKVIMTFQFVNVDFMFGLLLDNKTAAEAASKMRTLKERLCAYELKFSEVFPVLLTDNGGEFSDVFAFENGLNEEPETKMFFCDPNAPYQKPHVENNHTLFRGIVETGTTLKENNLEVKNTIVPISARLIANKSSFKFKSEQIEKIAKSMEEMTEAK